MGIERKFISDNIRRLEVKEFLEGELERAGCGDIEIRRTPLGTRVILRAHRPGLVIGKKGTAIRKLTNVLKKKYELDNPQIEVSELQIPELNAQVMAESIASSIERGIHFRRAAYTCLRRIMDAGARGAQIEISGKLTGERAKSIKFTDGYLKQCGEPAILYVNHGFAEAAPKPGIIGVKVKIMPPGVKLPDEIEFAKEEEVKEAKKIVPEKIEELAEAIEGELETIEEEVAGKPKKIKVEKVKRKKKKKVEVQVEKPPEEMEEELEEESKEEGEGEESGDTEK